MKTCPHKNLYMDVHRSIIYNSKKKKKERKKENNSNLHQDEWIHKIRSIHALEYFSVIKGMRYWFMNLKSWKHYAKKVTHKRLHICCSVAQWCPTLPNPMDCNTSGFPVHYQLLEFTQTHVHWVSDAIQPSHPLSSPSPPAFNFSQHQGLPKWVSSLHKVAKVLEF